MIQTIPMNSDHDTLHKRTQNLSVTSDDPHSHPATPLSDWGELQTKMPVISSDFPLQLTGFFPGTHLIHFLVLKMKDFWNFVLDNCILVFDAEQVYLKLQATNLKNKEVTVNPKPQTLEKNWFFENPKP